MRRPDIHYSLPSGTLTLEELTGPTTSMRSSRVEYALLNLPVTSFRHTGGLPRVASHLALSTTMRL